MTPEKLSTGKAVAYGSDSHFAFWMRDLIAEIEHLQAENARLLKIIREVSHSSQLALPVAEPAVPGITQDGMEL